MSHSNFEALKYLGGAGVIGIMSILWLSYYEGAAWLMGLSVGLWSVYMGAVNFSWLAFIFLIVGGVLVGACFAVDNHLWKTKRKRLTKRSWFLIATIYPGIAILSKSMAVSHIVAGLFILSINAATLLVKLNPDRTWRLGPWSHKPKTPPNPAVEGTLRDEAAHRPLL